MQIRPSTKVLLKTVALLGIFFLPIFQSFFPMRDVKELLQKSHKGLHLNSKHFQTIYTDQTPIDVLLVASSNTNSAVDTLLLARLLERPSQPSVNVVILYLALGGNELQLHLVRELLKNRRVRFAILEAPAEEQTRLHPATCMHPEFMIWGPILAQSSYNWHFNLYSCSVLAALRTVYTRIDQEIAPAQDLRSQFSLSNWKTIPEDSENFPPGYSKDFEDYSANIVLTSPLIHSSIDAYGNAASSRSFAGQMTGKILDEFDAFGVQAAGFRPARKNSKVGVVPILPSVLAEFGARKVDIIYLPKEVLLAAPHAPPLEWLYLRGNTNDNIHVNQRGRTISTYLLARQIALLLDRAKVGQ